MKPIRKSFHYVHSERLFSYRDRERKLLREMLFVLQHSRTTLLRSTIEAVYFHWEILFGLYERICLAAKRRIQLLRMNMCCLIESGCSFSLREPDKLHRDEQISYTENSCSESFYERNLSLPKRAILLQRKNMIDHTEKSYSASVKGGTKVSCC